MTKVRRYSRGTRQYLTFVAAPYSGGAVRWPKVATTSGSLLAIRFPKLVAIGGVHGQITEHRQAVSR
jgi:hypothetical protein